MWKKLFGSRAQDSHTNEDKPVHHAAREGLDALRRLLTAQPALRDQPGWYGRQPIHVVAEAGQLECLDLLLTLGAAVNACEGLHQQTPLHFAVNADCIDCVQRLLAAGADVNAADGRGETPIFYARSRVVIERLATNGANLAVISQRGQYPFEYCAAYIRSVDVLRFWLEQGVDLNHVPQFGWPALNAICGMPPGPQKASDDDRDVALLELLIDHGADVSVCSSAGDPALYEACVGQRHGLVEKLLSAGANPNQPNRSGDTALHAAVFRKDDFLVRMLVLYAADVNITNRHRKTPFDICAVEKIREFLTPYHQPKITPVPTADECLARLRAIPRFRNVTCRGCSPAEIAQLEQQLAVQFPRAYRDFLSTMGKGVGEFMVSDCWTFQFDDLPEIARDDEYAEYCDLPPDYFVFAERSGCFWMYFVADGSCDDPPVFGFDDGEERCSRPIGRSIWEFIESLVIDYEIWSEDGGAE